MQASAPLAQFLDYCTYGYMIDNVVLVVTGVLHERDVHVRKNPSPSPLESLDVRLTRRGAGLHRSAARTRRARVEQRVCVLKQGVTLDDEYQMPCPHTPRAAGQLQPAGHVPLAKLIPKQTKHPHYHTTHPQELLDKCNPLGMFDSIATLAVAQNMQDLYRLVLVDTPLAPYFRSGTF